MCERCGVHDEARVGIEGDEVRVVALGYPALARVEIRELCWTFAHPARELLEGRAALARSCPDSGERKLQRSDATPGRKEIATGVLQLGRARRMVRRDEIDLAGNQCAPERLSLGAIANRRGALVLRRAVRHLLRAEREIVRASLDGDREPASSRILDDLER